MIIGQHLRRPDVHAAEPIEVVRRMALAAYDEGNWALHRRQSIMGDKTLPFSDQKLPAPRLVNACAFYDSPVR
jgi:hypothetical protein